MVGLLPIDDSADATATCVPRHVNSKSSPDISAYQVTKTLFLHVTKRCGNRSKRVRTADANGRPDNKMRDLLSVCTRRVNVGTAIARKGRREPKWKSAGSAHDADVSAKTLRRIETTPLIREVDL
jgi:hypothetical protein